MPSHWKLEDLAKKKWYTQGVPAKPIHLSEVAGQPFMKKSLGFCYDVILGVYKEDYGEWNYAVSDLENHSKIIFERLKKDPHYLEKVRKMYDADCAAQESIFKSAEGDLQKLSDTQLLQLLHRFGLVRGHTVGISHVIESTSLALEHHVRHRLMLHAKGKKLNEDFSLITAPTTQSFMSQKDEWLWKIKHLNGKERQTAVKEYLNKFYWINTGYVGAVFLSVQDVLNAAEELITFSKPVFDETIKRKEKLFREYHFSDEEKHLIRAIEFVTDWQDERKGRILRGVYAMHRLLNEVSLRFGVSLRALEYFMSQEITLELLLSGKMESIGAERRKGCLLLELENQSIILDHSQYLQYQQLTARKHDEIEVICGTCASLGNATGVVRVLTTLNSISEMKEGEILVAPMTRPEYVPAMKKAAAIVTDEGGITSHAAIVSRELGKPCVIGTKNATKVLKDGDIVEVKASHGQIVVLKTRKS